MKKLLHIFSCIIFCIPFICKADYEVLWWLVDDSSSVDLYGNATTVGEYADSHDGMLFARIKAENQNTGQSSYLPFYQLDDDAGVFPSQNEGLIDSWQVPPLEAFTTLEHYGSVEWAFSIELGNYENDTWTSFLVSETRSYASLSEHISSWTPGTTPIPHTPWESTYFIPEPNAGLLMLIGIAVLSLKRKTKFV